MTDYGRWAGVEVEHGQVRPRKTENDGKGKKESQGDAVSESDVKARNADAGTNVAGEWERQGVEETITEAIASSS